MLSAVVDLVRKENFSGVPWSKKRIRTKGCWSSPLPYRHKRVQDHARTWRGITKELRAKGKEQQSLQLQMSPGINFCFNIKFCVLFFKGRQSLERFIL